MAGKVEARRAALRDALIHHAEIRIERDGLKNLRARDLAKDAGCALGAIYNVFGDLNDPNSEISLSMKKAEAESGLVQLR